MTCWRRQATGHRDAERTCRGGRHVRIPLDKGSAFYYYDKVMFGQQPAVPNAASELLVLPRPPRDGPGPPWGGSRDSHRIRAELCTAQGPQPWTTQAPQSGLEPPVAAAGRLPSREDVVAGVSSGVAAAGTESSPLPPVGPVLVAAASAAIGAGSSRLLAERMMSARWLLPSGATRANTSGSCCQVTATWPSGTRAGTDSIPLCRAPANRLKLRPLPSVYRSRTAGPCALLSSFEPTKCRPSASRFGSLSVRPPSFACSQTMAASPGATAARLVSATSSGENGTRADCAAAVSWRTWPPGTPCPALSPPPGPAARRAPNHPPLPRPPPAPG